MRLWAAAAARDRASRQRPDGRGRARPGRGRRRGGSSLTEIGYLGLVPARRGSKGVERKNLADLGGRPLLAWTLEAARDSTRLDSILLSTDDEDAIELAGELGVEAPFVRPAELAADETPMLDVVLHAVDWLEQERGSVTGTVVLLQPTSPFRDAADIDAAVAAFEKAGRDTLVSVAPVAQHPCDCIRVEDGRLRHAVEPPAPGARRQDMPEFLYLNGAIYVARVAALRARGRFVGEDSALHLMERGHSLDIDDEFELELARGLVALRGAAE